MPFKNRKDYNEYHMKYQRLYNAFLKRWVVDKLERRCMNPDCNIISEHDCIYDLHHKNGDGWTNKGRNKSNFRLKDLLKWKSIDKIPDDILLLCANCHRLEHEGKRGRFNVTNS